MKLLSTIIITALLMVGCGNQAEMGSNIFANGSVTVSGQVFVVTKGRENIKLALVNIVAIPEKEFAQYIKTQHENGLEQQKLIMPDMELANKALSVSVEAEKRAHARFEKDMADGKFFTGSADAYEAAMAFVRTNKIALMKVKNKIDYFVSVEYYIEKLPPQFAASKTDADGKFTLSLPSGKYVLAAKSSRDAFGITENYNWLVRVDTSSPNHSLMLSNDNFFETKCNECVKL